MKSINIRKMEEMDARVDEEEDKNAVPFPFNELFFSRTDSRGIILSGNSVFQRISQYGWGELIKKPHNIIRHPDMPKGVFYLLWHFIKQDKPIGAYVKNRAKDGRYYWVFAIVTPVEDGYLSVRLKPSSEFFGIVEGAYKALLAYERENKVSPKESMEHLLGMLKPLGFDSYDAFMSVALRMEVAARDVALARETEPFVACCEELSQRASALMKETMAIFSVYAINRYVPMNLQIQAAQLGNEGKAIGVISGNFSIVSNEIQEEINRFSCSAREVFDKIYEGQFLLCTACIQKEVVALFREESASGDAANEAAQEMNLLIRQLEEYECKAQEGLRSIMHSIANYQEDCQRMKKCAASLEVIRIMGKVDAARISGVSSGLHELLDELGTFQNTIAQSIAELEKHNKTMRRDTEDVIISLNKM